MSDFENGLFALFGLAIFVTFVVMVVKRPSEIREEKFDKRDW